MPPSSPILVDDEELVAELRDANEPRRAGVSPRGRLDRRAGRLGDDLVGEEVAPARDRLHPHAASAIERRHERPARGLRDIDVHDPLPERPRRLARKLGHEPDAGITVIATSQDHAVARSPCFPQPQLAHVVREIAGGEKR